MRCVERERHLDDLSFRIRERIPITVFDCDRIRILDGKEPVVFFGRTVNDQMKPLNPKLEIVGQPGFEQVAVPVDVADEFQAHGQSNFQYYLWTNRKNWLIETSDTCGERAALGALSGAKGTTRG